jgi:hypothetical protein
LRLTIPEIEELVKEMEADTKALKKDLFRMCWFMRGSLTFEEAFQLDFENREIISKIIDSNLETTKETKLPFF